ncbi:YncE family protein [Nocardia sp. NPDC058518]|uniref:YncE family protein n=1 Tax=Nocardia sp. NPDC058518 TaxID=3346534 RepID=UPI00364C276E
MASIAVDGVPIAMAVGLGRVFVTLADSDTVAVLDIDDRSVRATVTVGRDPGGLAVDPTTSTVWVADTEADTVSIIDADSAAVVATIPVGTRPRTVGIDARTRLAYIANYGGSLSVINADTRAVTSTIPVDGSPMDLVVSTERHAACYSTYSDLPPNDNTKVRCVDGTSNARILDIDVDHLVGALAVEGRTLYVADRGGNRVSVVDLAAGTVTRQLDVGAKPIAIAVDSASGATYVVNSSADTISVFSPE